LKSLKSLKSMGPTRPSGTRRGSLKSLVLEVPEGCGGWREPARHERILRSWAGTRVSSRVGRARAYPPELGGHARILQIRHNRYLPISAYLSLMSLSLSLSISLSISISSSPQSSPPRSSPAHPRPSSTPRAPFDPRPQVWEGLGRPGKQGRVSRVSRVSRGAPRSLRGLRGLQGLQGLSAGRRGP
jgi:hypothetical protein